MGMPGRVLSSAFISSECGPLRLRASLFRLPDCFRLSSSILLARYKKTGDETEHGDDEFMVLIPILSFMASCSLCEFGLRSEHFLRMPGVGGEFHAFLVVVVRI
jgi:hypothetical protein